MPSIDDAGRFSHTQLNLGKASFRLVKIVAGHCHEGLNCQITEERLDTLRGQYVAVSYTWGSDESDRSVSLNGRRFPVRENLYALLRSINKQFCTTPLWIDAMCIDQSSLVERNHQVAMMGEIFSNASMVYAWMGPADDDSDWLFDFLNHSYHDLAGTDFFQGQSFRFLLALQRFAERMYWTRIWIVQELVLATDIVLACGDRSIRWRVIEKLFANLILSSQRLVGAWQWNPQITTISQVLATRRSVNSLEDLFGAFRDKECSIPHDKIYALLGIVTGRAALQSDARIFVDYESSIVDLLYQLVTSWRHFTRRKRQLPLDFVRKFVETVPVDVRLLRTSRYGACRISGELDLRSYVGTTTSEQSGLSDWEPATFEAMGRTAVLREQQAYTNDWQTCSTVSDSTSVRPGDLLLHLTHDFPKHALIVRQSPRREQTGDISYGPLQEIVGVCFGFWFPLYTRERAGDVLRSSFLFAFAQDAKLTSSVDQIFSIETSFHMFVCLAKYLSPVSEWEDLKQTFGEHGADAIRR